MTYACVHTSFIVWLYHYTRLTGMQCLTHPAQPFYICFSLCSAAQVSQASVAVPVDQWVGADLQQVEGEAAGLVELLV